jgi:hypothetical protein
MTRRRRLPLALLAMAAVAVLARPAHAACTSPAGVESTMIWDWTSHTMTMCDGTNWLSMGGGGSSSGTAGYIQFSDGAGGFSSDSTSGGQLFWDSTSHRLLVGSTTAYAGNGNTTPRLQINGIGATGPSSVLLANWGNDGNFPVLYLGKSKSGTTGTHGASTSGDVTGVLEFSGSDGDEFRATARIQSGVSGTVSDNVMPGYLAFYTNIGTTTSSERMRIDKAGNVGIGTTAPSHRLTVAQTDTSTSGAHTMIRNDFAVAPSANSSADFTSQTTRTDVTGSFNVTGLVVANSGYASHSGSGTVTSVYGGTNSADNLSTGTITNGIGTSSYARANSAGTITNAYGSKNLATSVNAAATIGTAYGASNEILNTAGTMATAVAGYNILTHNAPTTMGTGGGVRSQVTTGSGATITNAEGLRIGLTNSGTVTSWKGLRIVANSGTAPGSSLALSVEDTSDSYFAGRVGIGTASPTEKLTVSGNVLATTYLYSSDRRLKTDIAPLLGQLEKVNALEPVSYTMKADPGHAKRLGLIAQDVEPLYPEIVHTNADGMKAIDYASLVAPLIAAVKELKAANDNLAATVEVQGREIEALKVQAHTTPTMPRPAPAKAFNP